MSLHQTSESVRSTKLKKYRVKSNAVPQGKLKPLAELRDEYRLNTWEVMGYLGCGRNAAHKLFNSDTGLKAFRIGKKWWVCAGDLREFMARKREGGVR